MENEILNLQNVFSGYGRRIVLKDVSFELTKGQIISLIGPNGQGKSTLLKSIGRQINLLGGKINLLQKPLESFAPADFAKSVSVLLTHPVHAEYMTCKEVVASARYPYTGFLGRLSSDDEKIINESLGMLNLNEIASVKFCEASDGQRQRVMIARALCQKPDVLLLDEPLSFLDINHKLHLLDLLRQISSSGISVIMSVHEIDFALKISDKILCISNNSCTLKNTDELYSGDEIKNIYSLSENSFDPCLGISELKAPFRPPKVFVFSDSGRGIPVYRRLAKKNIPFAAGILFENDIDFPYAKMIASKVFSCKAFSRIDDSLIADAKRCIDSCTYVMNAGITESECTMPVQRLIEYSEAKLWHFQ